MNNFKSQLMDATFYPNEKYLFFYGGIFSQWAEGTFFCKSLKLNVNCAEQAMMLHKAELFNDKVAYNEILNSNNPRVQKAIGRQIVGYNDTEWDKVKYDIVMNINYDKFSQLFAWRELLFLTHDYLLVEASPTDRIWGIGMGENNPNLLDTSSWGSNLLGLAITEARSKIFNN